VETLRQCEERDQAQYACLRLMESAGRTWLTATAPNLGNPFWQSNGQDSGDGHDLPGLKAQAKKHLKGGLDLMDKSNGPPEAGEFGADSWALDWVTRVYDRTHLNCGRPQRAA
jgi:hypothetical protein